MMKAVFSLRNVKLPVLFVSCTEEFQGHQVQPNAPNFSILFNFEPFRILVLFLFKQFGEQWPKQRREIVFRVGTVTTESHSKNKSWTGQNQPTVVDQDSCKISAFQFCLETRQTVYKYNPSRIKLPGWNCYLKVNMSDQYMVQVAKPGPHQSPWPDWTWMHQNL